MTRRAGHGARLKNRSQSSTARPGVKFQKQRSEAKVQNQRVKAKRSKPEVGSRGSKPEFKVQRPRSYQRPSLKVQATGQSAGQRERLKNHEPKFNRQDRGQVSKGRVQKFRRQFG